MNLVSRLEQIADYAKQLTQEAVRLNVPTDAFNERIHKLIYDKSSDDLLYCEGGHAEIMRDIDHKTEQINKGFETQFSFLLKEAGHDYKYFAECLLDEIREKAKNNSES